MVIVWQRVEGLIVCACAFTLYFYYNSGIPWWAAVLIFFSPDLSLFGYLASKRIGAHLYNLLHIYALGSAIAVAGLLLNIQTVTMIGLLLIAHCGYDRALGYGLKHLSGFHFTHLGTIGKRNLINREA